MVERYIPSIGNPDWDIRQCPLGFRTQLKERLKVAQVCTEREYKTVIAYLYSKFPQEMDGLRGADGRENVAIQWLYSTAKNKLSVPNDVTGKPQDMYAFIVYDEGRDMEPIAFAGSYFKLAKIDETLPWNEAQRQRFAVDGDGIQDLAGGYFRIGVGYVLFVDPSYRRMNLGTDLWWAESQLYVQHLGIRAQKEIQNTYSLESTRKMFSDPSKCVVTSEGRLKQDGTRSQIRCLLDYDDEYLKKCFDGLPEGMKGLHNVADWRFLKREGLNVEDLLKHWV